MQLTKEVFEKEVYLTVTVQKNKVELPAEVKRMKLKNQDMKAFRQQDNIMVLAWQDKRLVLMLSTLHNADTVLIKRCVKKTKEEIYKLYVVVDYTEKRGGNDRPDHYCTSYSFTYKSLRWWQTLFYWLLEVAVVNSFILYTEIHNLSQARHL